MKPLPLRRPQLVPHWQRVARRSAVVIVSAVSSLLSAAPFLVPQLQQVLDPWTCLKISAGIFALIPVVRLIKQDMGIEDADD
ncbi:hypothetical protein NAC44_11890 [Allorhizobium sp. BGMRC 0089]|uniref:DUF7940 domain-containing protein n=1 Tax=Allorhizobium sonneratiae TaxID=2934936 RepID=UPI002033989C|nr:hypothetical protein [Allorhizobium sonneratiae]MCM2293023.1 hypothetical protein [Allorhizobium sonneratiae]